MVGRRSPRSSSINQSTSQPETIPSCYRRSRHTKFQPNPGRMALCAVGCLHQRHWPQGIEPDTVPQSNRPIAPPRRSRLPLFGRVLNGRLLILRGEAAIEAEPSSRVPMPLDIEAVVAHPIPASERAVEFFIQSFGLTGSISLAEPIVVPMPFAEDIDWVVELSGTDCRQESRLQYSSINR
jgi:hypothetical protein